MIRIFKFIFFKIKNRQVHRNFRVNGTQYITSEKIYRDKKSFPNFQKSYKAFLKKIETSLEKQASLTFYKFGDGDYYFLNRIPVGSAKPGNRAISVPFDKINIDDFVQKSRKCDFYMCEILPHNKSLFAKVFQGIPIDFPAEFIYASVASKDLFRLIQNSGRKVGLIGADSKLQIISELFKYDSYKNYIGIDRFDQYIGIPQKFACDIPELILTEINEKISSYKCDIYLLGVGHLKSYILSELGSKWNSIFLDVGSCIDALAGVIDTNRPYFSQWQNYTLPDQKIYTNLDYLQFNHMNKKFLLESDINVRK